jgi:LPXTG-motif cell wall-anchored protein
MILAAMLALVVVAASPAFAQSGSQIEVEEGSVTQKTETTVVDSIVSSCPADVTIGDANGNAQVVVESQNGTVVFEGNENEAEIAQALGQSGFNPSAATACTQQVAQAAAAGEGKAEATAGKAEAKAEAPKAEAKAGGAEAKAAPAPAPKAEAKAELPKTGGGTTLLALGAGALIVGGGLVARRMIK